MTVRRVGITGHTDLTKRTAELIHQCLLEELRGYPEGRSHGVTCLADGADQVFAAALLAAGGDFDVILPARDYRSSAIHPGNRDRFDSLLARARCVRPMPFARCGNEAYTAASAELVRGIDRLVAVWDGKPQGLPGGTTHTVALARRAGVPVTRIWPPGARRRPPDPSGASDLLTQPGSGREISLRSPHPVAPT